MVKQSYKLRLNKVNQDHKIKILKGGDRVETTETFVFAVSYMGINVKLELKGNAEDIRKNFSHYNFNIEQKTFIQLDINSKIAQKVLEQFAENGDGEEDDDDGDVEEPDDPLDGD